VAQLFSLGGNARVSKIKCPYQKLIMKILNFSLRLFALFALIQTTAFGQTNFLVTPSLGFQVSFPGQEGYQYQVSSSTDLTNWSPVTDLEVSCGGIETFSFGMTNGSHTFYRAEGFPPNLADRIVGLTNIFFDNAVFSGQGATMTVSGFRAQSRDYNLNDYLTATFQFDLCKQAFSMSGLQVITNLGVVCGQTPSYFIKDATNQLVLTNELTGTTLTRDTVYTITSTGQVMTVNMGIAQVFAFDLHPLSYTNRVIVTDPNGNTLFDQILTPTPGVYYLAGGYGGFVAGVYKLQVIPQGISSESITFSFHNDNGKQLRVLTNGMVFSTSSGDYGGDYDNFQVSLTAGQTLQLGGVPNGADMTIFNSLGVPLASISWPGSGTGPPLIFPAHVTDTYYVIYWHSVTVVGDTHPYSTTVSITP
jgi:hypothetical protein